jgi:adenylylsulfate kinase-like enzyme
LKTIFPQIKEIANQQEKQSEIMINIPIKLEISRDLKGIYPSQLAK